MRRIIFTILILCSGIVFSQENTSEDLKVGLVLSGGGAKGMAHIGALKMIEEAGIRIDYIGGTSMGAIVGGLYASGYSASQLDSIFKNVDFSELIQDKIPRRAKTFYEKEESEKYAVTLPFDGFKLSFPSGISKGQNIYNLLSKLTSHVSDIEDFNELPIPFICIATNLESGNETLLNNGYLPRAMKASGSLPTLFSPVKIKDSLYIDGGITNNYPIEQVRAMGADVIIGIDVQDPLKTRKDLKSIINVMGQINNYRTLEDMVEKSLATDIYIRPKMEGFTIVSFTDGKDIIDAGTKEAKLHIEELKALAKRQKPSQKKQIDFVENDMLYITNVEINGNVNYTRAFVLGKLKLKAPSNTSYKSFSDGVNNLSATGNFQEINYRFYKNESGGLTVKFDLIESDSKSSIRLSAHYDDLYKTAVLINFTTKRLITNNDITSFDFIVGDKIRYNFDYFIDKGYYWSIGLKSNYSNFDENVGLDFAFPEGIPTTNSDLNQINIDYGQLTNQIYLQTFFKRKFLLGIGAEHKWIEYISETIGIDEDDLPRTVFDDTNYFSGFGYIVFDTFDDKFFPTKGFYFRGDLHVYLHANGFNTDFEEFSIGKAKIGYAKTFVKKLSTAVYAEGGYKIEGNKSTSFDFFVGGYGFKEENNLVSLYGFDNLSLRGNTYLKATFELDYNVYKKAHVNFSANIANVGDDLFVTNEWVDRVDYSGYAVGFAWDTFMGPIEAKYSFSPNQESIWYVVVGYSF